MFRDVIYLSIITLPHCIFLVFVWTTEMPIETHHIPTIVNGMTTCISLIVGFNLTALTILISKLSEYYPETTKIVDSAFLLAVPIIMLLTAYFGLVLSEYQLALKFAFSGLDVAFLILLPSLVFFGKKLHTQERKPKKTN